MSRFAILAVTLLLSLQTAFAQTGSVRIRVTDNDGHAIRGAAVSLYNNWNRKIGEYSPNPASEFLLPRLPFGEWRFTVVAEGFTADAFSINICDSREQTFRAKLGPAPPQTDLFNYIVTAAALLLKLDPMPYCDVLDLPQPRRR